MRHDDLQGRLLRRQPRHPSINRKLAKALIRLPPEAAFTEIPFRDLPLYSYDYDDDYPPVALAFKAAIRRRTRSCS